MPSSVRMEKKLQSTSQNQTCNNNNNNNNKNSEGGVMICLVICCQSDPLKLFGSWWNHNIWGICSANQWDALKSTSAAGISEKKGPNSAQLQYLTTCHTTNTLKNWINLAIKFCLICCSHLTSCQLITISASQLFIGRMLTQSTEWGKCFPRVHQIRKHGFLWQRS